jgi:hypothetical protein
VNALIITAFCTLIVHIGYQGYRIWRIEREARRNRVFHEKILSETHVFLKNLNIYLETWRKR